MNKNLEGKVAVVTGGTRGIGRAIAQQLVELGAAVVVAGTNREKSEAAALEIGGNSMGIELDVANPESCKAMIEKTVENFGGLDVLVNNAGITGIASPTAQHTPESWQQVMDVNVNGVFYCTVAAIPHMQRNGGAVINLSSVDGLVGMASLSHYSSSKHAVIGFTKSAALEYGKDNIRVVAVAPGFISTQMTDDLFTDAQATVVSSMTALGRPAKPREVASMVCWLASDEASYVTGCCLQVDGGLLAGFGEMQGEQNAN
jgi:NAD(P)-dependent dehydrogenase (short-subunit alcohol dehydrogenase family)